jgi:succinylglutamate desuccinylase
MSNSFTADVRPRLSALLERFERSARPGPFAYRLVHHADGGQHPTHIVFGCMVHGNEHGSLPAAVRLVEGLNEGSIKFGGKVSIFIGNPEAALADARYLEADLNRVFLDTGEDRHEDRRAKELMPILDAADVFLDFHQTILPTAQPFYIFPWQEVGWKWARATRGTDVWVTRDPSVGFSSGSKCSDEYVADRGRPGMTLELSQKGFSDAAESLCLKAMLETLRAADEVHKGPSIGELASRRPDLTFLTTTFIERFDDPEKALTPGLVNFQPVQRGQPLHTAASPPMHAPGDGVILFPKYPERDGVSAKAPWPKEIYRLVSPMSTHPSTLWGSD